MNTKIEKILRAIIFTGLFGILFIPFIVDQSMFFPFITGKGFNFRIVVEIIFSSFLILALFKKEYRPKKSTILFAVAAFLLSLTVSAVFSENPYKSFWSNFERMEGLITHIHLFLYFVVLGTMIQTEKIWTRFFNTSLFANSIMVGYALLQLSGKFEINQGGVRVDGTLGNATYLAIYIVFHIFLALFFFFKTKNNYVRSAYGILIALNLYILYETQTRGAILGLLGGLLLTGALILWRERSDALARKSAMGLCIGVLVLVGGFIAIKDSAFVTNNSTLVRFSKISVDQAQNQARYYVWPIAVEGFLERPIFGWGQESFNHVFNKYYNPELYKHEQWFDRTHNVILDWLVAGGLIGFLLYMSIFVFALRSLWKTTAVSERDKSILTGLFAAYFLHNLFVFDNLISYVMFFSVLAFIHSTTSGEKRIWQSRTLSQTALYVTTSVIIVALVSVLYFANAKPMFASKTLIEGITPRVDGNVAKNLEALKRALAYKTFGDSEIREYLAQTTTRVIAIPEVPSDVKTSFATFAQEELDIQLKKIPNDTRYLMFAAVLANSVGNYEGALSYLKRAQESSPGKQAVYFEMGTSYLRMGRNDDALMAFKQAYELEPNFESAHIIYAVGALYAGQDALAQELLSSLPEQVYYFDDRIFQAYAQRREFNRLLEILDKRIAQNPDDVTNHLNRAGVYLEMGNRQASITELQEVIRLNPDFKKQGDRYISEIRAGRNP